MDAIRDHDGDRTMEDVNPYNTDKYTTSAQASPSLQRTPARLTPTQPDHREVPSSNVASNRFYSPMDASPPSPWGQFQQQQQQHQGHAFPSSNPASTVDPHHPTSQPPSRQSRPTSSSLSPSRLPPQHYTSTPTSARSAVTSHPHQLPPLQSPMTPADSTSYPQSATAHLNAVFGRDSRTPKYGPFDNRSDSAESRKRVPRFVPCADVADLEPRINAQPPFRRAAPEGGFISPLQALTTHLPSTYRICNPSFQYEISRNPRRVLTKPSKGTKNDGYDNDDSDYILYVNDILGSEETNHKNRYLILDVLGQGTFGQVVKCQNLRTQEVVAVKVVKNRTAYFNQSMMEVSVLDLLNSRMDKNDDHHILRLKDTFIHRQHLCLVFELLSVNLYELIKQNQFRGLSTTLVRVFAQQLLNGLCLLNKARLIHCDLKPENILLKNLESPIIKIIDFGSACDDRQTVYTYIQSRFYRSPEVLLGLPYSAAIDMWSLGCIVVELFLGLPLFPGSSEYNQVSRITEMLGLPPTWMLEVGKQSGEFFDKSHDDCGRRTYRLKTMEQYSRDHGNKEQPSKKYFAATTLPEIIRNYPMPRKGMKQAEIDREMSNRVAFIDFVHGLLNINPLERWTPQQARTHPFITQQKFTGPFQPQMSLRTSAARSPAPGLQQQQQAEALSKQRAQAAQQQVQQTQAAVNAAYAGMHMQSPGGYQMSSPHAQQSPQAMYGSNVFSPTSAGGNAPPTYGNQPTYPQQQVPTMVLPPPPAAASSSNRQQSSYSQHGGQYAPQYAQQPQQHQHQQAQQSSSLYAQATTRAGRQRASTMDIANGIPAAFQRVVSHLDPNAPIRSQPSPAYYPPSQLDGGSGYGVPPPTHGHASHSSTSSQGGLGPGAGQGQGQHIGPGPAQQGGQYDSRRASRGARTERGNFVRQLEDRTLEEGWSGPGGQGTSGGGGGWA